MFRSITLTTALVLLAALPTLSFAQPQKGNKELLLSANVNTTMASSPFGDSTTSSSGNVFGGLGVFVSNRVQIGLSPSLSIGQGAEGGVDTNLGLGTHLQYFLGAQDAKVKPYIGYMALISSFKTAEGGSLADNLYNAAQFGVKNYFSERTALDFNASYGFAARSVSNRSLDIRVGISYLF